jgi:hypothetical protein
LALLQSCLLLKLKNQAKPLHSNKWIAVGVDALEAQRQRNARLDDDEFKRLQGTAPVQSPTAAPICGKTPLSGSSLKVFLEPRSSWFGPQDRRLCYPWHPWYSRSVLTRKAGGAHAGMAYFCKLPDAPLHAMLVEILKWMFDAARWAKMRVAELPGLKCDTVGFL